MYFIFRGRDSGSSPSFSCSLSEVRLLFKIGGYDIADIRGCIGESIGGVAPSAIGGFVYVLRSGTVVFGRFCLLSCEVIEIVTLYIR